MPKSNTLKRAHSDNSSKDQDASQMKKAVWILTWKHGYPADGFHSYSDPSFEIKGVYNDSSTGKARAKKEAERLVGSDVGYTFDEVEKGDDLEIEENDNKIEWEWSPPDSEYSIVTMTKVNVTEDDDKEEEGAGEDADQSASKKTRYSSVAY